MKIILLLLSLAISTLAVVPERQVLITYPDDTPPAELHRAKSAIEEAGGRILHDFDLLKGFVVKASHQAIDTVSTLSAQFKPIIEDDKEVTTQ